MAFEVPLSLIRDLQADLRRDAGLPSFDSGDPSIPPLLTVVEAIERLDSSVPSDLRCQACRGPLLRGLQSQICVFCGAEKRREDAFPPISLGSTFGCRRFLESLGLDRIEPIASVDETNLSNKNQEESTGRQGLLNLLELELHWQSNVQETNYNIDKPSSQIAPALNLSGFDLDTFFLEKVKESPADSIIENKPSFMSEQQYTSSGTHLFPGLDSSTPANVQHTDTEMSSSYTIPEESSTFSGWEADFKSSNAEVFPILSKSENILQLSNDVSSPINSIYPHEATSASDGGEHENIGAHLSPSDNLTEDVFLSNYPSRVGTDLSDQFNNSDSIIYVRDSSVQVNPRLAIDNNIPYNTRNADDDSDPFVVWQGFSNSDEASGDISNTQLLSWSKTNSLKQSIQENTSDAYDTEFGDFVHSDFYPQSSSANNWIDENTLSNLGTKIKDNGDILQGFPPLSDEIPPGSAKLNLQTAIEAPNYETKPSNLNPTVYENVLHSFSSESQYVNHPLSDQDGQFHKNGTSVDDIFNQWNVSPSNEEAQSSNSNFEVRTDIKIQLHELVLEDMEFGDFLHSNNLSGSNTNDGNFYRDRDNQLDTSASGRLIKEHFSSQKTNGELNNVEKLLSQIHDLSFMLDDQLNVPTMPRPPG